MNKITARHCDCEAYKKNIQEIKDAFVFLYVHEMKYEGDQFEFCPWCGKKLIESKLVNPKPPKDDKLVCPFC